MPTVSSWWNGRYTRRRQLTVGDAIAVPAKFCAKCTFDLSTVQAILTNRNDVRVAYWDGASWTEKDRILFADNELYFAIDAAIGAGATDSGYYLYYGNQAAGTPPAAMTNIFVPRLNSDTLSLYHFNPITGGVDMAAGQLGGQANNDINSGITVSTDAPQARSWIGDGLINSAARFNNSDSNLANTGRWGSTAAPLRTVEFFAKTATNAAGAFVNYWRTDISSDSKFYVVKNTGGQLEVRWRDQSNNENAITLNSFFPNDGVWHHFAVVWTNTNINCYRDNVLISNPSGIGVPRQFQDHDWPQMFSRFDGGNNALNLAGSMADVRLSRAIESSFPHGARQSLPTLSFGNEESASLAVQIIL